MPLKQNPVDYTTFAGVKMACKIRLMELTPQLLLSAYTQGLFPMAQDDSIYWYQPDPRAILPLDAFHIPRSLRRALKQHPFQVTTDRAFEAVMRFCAAPNNGREETWISEELITAYTRLHRLGYAHSVETWQNGRLAGGLYGITIGGFFAGESMFSRQRDASKVALAHLVERLRAHRFQLLDVQFMTDHLRRFGTIEIPNSEYQQRLQRALAIQTRF
jgi:leucyl/phenylalanyl-tRNA---protein transferase